MDPSSLSARKSSFLLSQIRLLSSPLTPSPAFTTTLNTTDTNLNQKTLNDLLTKINDKLKTHNKSVFPALTQRHIVEQIESLYFSEALADPPLTPNDISQGDELVAIERDADLTSSQVLAGLPEELTQAMLNDVSDLGIDEDQADQYYELRRQLVRLAEKRDAAREKLQGYEKLQDLLRPFENAGENVQPNLVTKDGEMSREMERMRVLLARVTGRLGDAEGLPERKEGEKSKTFDEKLRTAMEMDSA